LLGLSEEKKACRLMCGIIVESDFTWKKTCCRRSFRERWDWPDTI